MDGEDGDVTPALQPCSICGRTFLPEALVRHERICKKTSEKKRKVFNSSKQRIEGTEIASNSPTTNKMVEKPQKKPNWREKHNEFIKNIRAAKGQNEETTEGNAPPKKNVPSDYIQCPSCERHFNQKAAERHIAWCQSQKAHTPKQSTINEAKERLQARTKYKAPIPGKKPKEAEYKKSAKPVGKQQPRVKTAKPSECSSSGTDDVRKRPEKTNPSSNSVKSGKPNTATSSPTDRDVIRSRESVVSQGSGYQRQAVKFKDKFPNHSNKWSPDFEDSFSSFSNASAHFKDILQTKASNSYSPRTVPGVRTGGLDTNTNWGPSTNGTSEDDNGLLQKIADLNSSFQANTSFYGDLNSSWSRKMFPPNHNLPEVSSCDEPTQTWPSRSCWGSSGNTPMSSGSSVSSLSTSTSGSRGGSSESVMPLFCCHCGSKYPISAAKYCCECGAKRRPFGTMSLKTELVSC